MTDMMEREQRQSAEIGAISAASGIRPPNSRTFVSGTLVEEREREDEIAHVGSVHFWQRPGGGYNIVTGIAVAHGAAGIFGAVAGALIWYFVAPLALLPVVAAVAGLAVAVAGAFAFELARASRAEVVLVARLLPPLADLLACGAVLWLVGDREFIVLLFIVPSCVAALLLSWRGGAVVALLSVSMYGLINGLQNTASPDLWVPRALALAAVSALVTLCVGVFAQQLSEISAQQQQRIVLLTDEHDSEIAQRQRLLEGINALEEAQGRLEQERMRINQQLAEVAGAARRLSEGDLDGTRGLQPGMYGPLDVLAGMLVRLGQQMSMMLGLRQQLAAQQQAMDALREAMRGQARLLVGAEGALRELNTSARTLVAEVQVVERGSGELLGVDRHSIFQAMHAIEQHAITQASHTAMLEARLSHLRARQSELEAGISRANAQGVPRATDTAMR